MNVLVEETSLQDIANAIREVTSTDEKIKPSEMGNAQRNFANGLIATANATTGKEDTTLTNAVNSLVSGFGQGGSETDYGLQLLNKTITEIPQAWKGVTEIKNHALRGCTELGGEIDFLEVETIGQYSFGSCSAITSAVFPKCTTIDLNCFDSCSELQVVDMPALTTLGIASNKGQHFANCKKLHTFNAPLLDTVRYNTFANCVALKKVNLPNVRICSNWAFASCGIESIYLPSMTGKVEDNCFANCKSLEIADLPLVTSIITNGFKACTALTTLIISNSTMVTLSNINAFTNTPIANGTGYIYVPKALIEDYKVATNWTTFASQFRAIEDYRDIIEPIFTENGHEYDWGDM